MENTKKTKVLIIGAGFGGIAAAKELYHRHLNDVTITLVSKTPFFDYHAALYRVLAGKNPMSSSILLREMFPRGVNIVGDTIVSVDFQKKVAYGKSQSTYHYDIVIFATGSETNYYDIPGIGELSFSIKNVEDAIRLKNHLHKNFAACAVDTTKNRTCNTHIVVVGGGATGVEVAGELAVYTKELAKKHGVDESYITIDLVTGSKRLVPRLPHKVSAAILNELRNLGVNIYLNRYVMKQEVEEIYMKDMKMQTKTVVWSAGSSGNMLLKQIGLPVNDNYQVIVNNYLKPVSENPDLYKGVFVIGDGAATKYAGMAMTAWRQGRYVADLIVRVLRNGNALNYEDKAPLYLIPVGPHWGAFCSKSINLFGYAGKLIIGLTHLRFFLSILPLGKAFEVWMQDEVKWETCPICRG